MEQLCVSVSDTADTASVSYLQEWKKRRVQEERTMTDESHAESKSKTSPSSTEVPLDASLRANTSKQYDVSSSETSSHSDFSQPPSRSASRKNTPTLPYIPPTLSVAPFNSTNCPSELNPAVWPSLGSIERLNRLIKPRKDGDAKGLILPSEILVKVFRFIPWPELLKTLALVSRDWLHIIRSDQLWQPIYHCAFGNYYDRSVYLQGTSVSLRLSLTYLKRGRVGLKNSSLQNYSNQTGSRQNTAKKKPSTLVFAQCATYFGVSAILLSFTVCFGSLTF